MNYLLFYSIFFQSIYYYMKWKDQLGEWKWTSGEFAGDVKDKGIKTSEDARFYGLSAKLSEAFTNKKDLVLQFSVKHEQDLDCGGAYIKLTGNKMFSTCALYT